MTNTKANDDFINIYIRRMNTPKEIFKTLSLIIKNMEFGKRSKSLNLFIKKMEDYLLYEQTTKNILDILTKKDPEDYEIEDFYNLLKLMNPCKDLVDYQFFISAIARNRKYIY